MLLSKTTARFALMAISSLLPLTLAAAPVNTGSTTVTFNTGTLSALTLAGFSLAPISPATLATSPAVTGTFPITGGDTTTVINHSGGLSLTRSGTTANLQNFDINLTNNTLFGQVTAGSTTLNNVALFDITATGGTTNLLLSSALSGAINQVFSVNLPSGTPFGTAVVTATPEPASFGLAGLSLLAGFVAWKKSRTA